MKSIFKMAASVLLSAWLTGCGGIIATKNLPQGDLQTKSAKKMQLPENTNNKPQIIKSLTRKEFEQILELYNDLITAAKYAYAYHVSQPRRDDLLEGRGMAHILAKLDPDKDYSTADINKIIVAEINEMLQELDPHSAYLTGESHTEFINVVRGNSFRFGIEFAVDRHGIKIKKIIPESPAHKMGMEAGDVITNIDGEKLQEKTLAEVNTIFDRKSTLSFVVLRHGSQEQLKFKITKEEFKVPSVTASLVNGAIGYIKIAEFTDDTAKDFTEQFTALQKQSQEPLEGLILDARNNPGGKPQGAVDIANYLTGQDGSLTIAKQKRACSLGDKFYFGNAAHGVTDLPIIVLVNYYTASTGEIFAGLLQDSNHAIVVGQTRTYGKANAQAIFPRITYNGQKASLKLTTGFVYLLDGSYQNIGIQPDILVSDRTPDGQHVIIDPNSLDRERDWENVLANPDGKLQNPPSALRCDVHLVPRNRHITSLNVGTQKTETIDLSGDEVMACAIDHVMQQSQYSFTRKNVPVEHVPMM